MLFRPRLPLLTTESPPSDGARERDLQKTSIDVAEERRLYGSFLVLGLNPPLGILEAGDAVDEGKTPIAGRKRGREHEKHLLSQAPLPLSPFDIDGEETHRHQRLIRDDTRTPSSGFPGGHVAR